MAKNEIAKATIYLDGKQAEAAMIGLNKRAKEVRASLREAQKAGDTVTMKRLERELKGIEAAQRSLKKEAFDVDNVLRNINKISWRDLEKAQRKIRSQMKGMERDTEAFAGKEKDLQLITAQLRKIRNAGKKNQSMWSKLANGANKYFAIITAGIAAITGIIFSVKEWIKGNLDLDDSLSDVMKTTGLTRKEVRLLYQDFRNLNTRTPRKELLLLAEEAGRLGKKSRKDVMDFVEVANKIKVALGDDLGGEASKAIREVGKLTEIYKVGDKYGTDFKESMNKIGSAINEVSANSNAQADFQIGYLKRMGGIAQQAKVTAGEMLGYASTLDQLGQSQEMAATAQGKIMIDMFTDHANYAKIARMESEEFYKLLQTNANEAFLKLLEGLNGNNDGMALMARRLDDLGVEGSRAVQVLSALSSNTTMVRKQQTLANEAMEEGISLSAEYETKNNNLAGSWDKLGQYIHSKFVNSKFIGWLENVVVGMAKWTEVPLKEKLIDQRMEMNKLAMKVTSLTEGTEEHRKAMEDLVKAYPDYFGSLDTAKTKNQELLDVLQKANRQMIRQIYIAGRREELKKLQENAAEKLAVEQQYNDELVQLKTSFFSKMNKKQQEAFAGEFDYIMNHYKKIRDAHGDGVKAQMAANQWLLKNQMHVSQGGLSGTDLSQLSVMYEKRREAYKQRYQAEKQARAEEKKILEFERKWLKDDNDGKGNGNNDDGKIVSSPKDPVAAVDLAHKQRLVQLKERYSGEEQLLKEFHARMLAEEIAYLQAKKGLETDESKKLDIQSQILDKQAEYSKALKDAVPDIINLHSSTDNLNTTLLEEGKLTQQMAERMKETQTASDQLTAKLTTQAGTYQQTIGVVSDGLFEMMSDSEDGFQKFAKNMLIFALEQLKVQAELAAAGVTIQSLASPESIATWGAAGLAKATLIIGLIEAAFAGLEGLVNSAFAGKEEGGPIDVTRAQDGKKFRAAYDPTKRGYVNKPTVITGESGSEYIVPDEGVNNPTIKPVLDMIEIARQQGTLETLDLSRVPVAGSVQGREAGGNVSDGSSSDAPSLPGTDPELKSILQKNNSFMEKLLNHGVRASVNLYGDDSIDQALTKREELKNLTGQK